MNFDLALNIGHIFGEKIMKGYFLNKNSIFHEDVLYHGQEIKPCGLGSRIQDMEAESYN